MDLTMFFQGITGQLANRIEVAAAVVIAVATIETLMGTVALFAKPRRSMRSKEALRLRLGTWLAVALELELAADILRTAIAPTFTQVRLLAAIAAIRTGRNFFLRREIERSRAMGEEKAAL